MTRSFWMRVGLIAASFLVVAGCRGGGGARHHVTSAVPQQRFAELKIVYDALLDYLDPALSYTTDG